MKRRKPASTEARIRKELSGIMPIFAHAAVGDFSHDVEIPKDDGAFGELYAGVQIMLDVIRTQLEAQQIANRRLQEVKDETEALLTSIGEGVVALDAEGRVKFINRAAV